MKQKNIKILLNRAYFTIQQNMLILNILSYTIFFFIYFFVNYTHTQARTYIYTHTNTYARHFKI